MNFSKDLLDDVADSGTTYHSVELGSVRADDQESGVKLEVVCLYQCAVVFLLEDRQLIGEGWVYIEEVANEEFGFDAGACTCPW